MKTKAVWVGNGKNVKFRVLVFPSNSVGVEFQDNCGVWHGCDKIECAFVGMARKIVRLEKRLERKK